MIKIFASNSSNIILIVILLKNNIWYFWIRCTCFLFIYDIRQSTKFGYIRYDWLEAIRNFPILLLNMSVFFPPKRITFDVDPRSYKFIEDLAYSIETQILKFWILGVFIHPEMQNKIVRPMVKDLAQLDLLFLSYGQVTVNIFPCLKNGKIYSYLAITKKR